MRKAWLIGAAAALTLAAAPALAQQSNPAANPPCGPAAAPPTTGAQHPGGEKPPQQPVERSAVLPDAAGHGESAAPTVKQDGKDVVAQTDCPKPPNRVDAPKTK